MNRKQGVALPVVIVIALVAFAAGAGSGVLGWIYLRGGSGEPTQDVSERAEQLTDEEAADNIALYRIDPEESEVRFTLEEDLRGVRTTVIGTTNQVAGDISVNFDDPAASQVGTIAINARTLATDNQFRNRAIRGEILLSAQDEYEFIEFEPTELRGLPDEAAPGETLEFEIVGQLTVVETTQEVVFDATAEVSEDGSTLTGLASTTINWRDFNLTIPEVPGVANITDEVDLEITFSAPRVDAEEPAEDAEAEAAS